MRSSEESTSRETTGRRKFL